MAASGSSSNLNAINNSSLDWISIILLPLLLLQLHLHSLLIPIIHEEEQINTIGADEEEVEELVEDEELFVNYVAKQVITQPYATADLTKIFKVSGLK
ncbi:hypothetical protein ACOSQ4_021572 [Xanthoceras sorbifolium]